MTETQSKETVMMNEPVELNKLADNPGCPAALAAPQRTPVSGIRSGDRVATRRRSVRNRLGRREPSG